MITLNNLDFACKETLKAHPEFDIMKIFQSLVEKDINFRLFTRQNGARDMISELNKDFLITEILKQTIKVGKLYDYYYEKNNEFSQTIPEGALSKTIADMLYKQEKNVVLYLKTNTNILSKLASSFAEVRYTKNGYYLDLLANIKTEVADKIISKQFSEVKGIENIRINDNTVNKCKEDILSGSQIKNSRSQYSLDGSLYAVSDIGKKRENQEDSVLIINHPEINDFKMLVVADGMGGASSGELASSYVVTKIMKWFESLDKNYFYNEVDLASDFTFAINKISSDLYNKYGQYKCGSTFTGSIVCNNKTVIANVGDSRAYTILGGNINQVTKDHSLVQRMYDYGDIKEKDDMRFHTKANVITAAIGSQEPVYPSVSIVDNNSYDMLMLFTDGVTDCLSDEQIKFIANTSPKHDVALALVNAANINNSSKKIYEEGAYVDKYISGGKDNLTAAIYSKGR
ncbi:MAG: serine/threonine-protein phosphatase [Tenericutes bacterium]|nr:serine/threonine-protein phosphatase [Mycoplasmatota bacterium]